MPITYAHTWKYSSEFCKIKTSLDHNYTFLLIWNQTKLRLVSNQSKKYNYNPSLVEFDKIHKLIPQTLSLPLKTHTNRFPFLFVNQTKHDCMNNFPCVDICK